MHYYSCICYYITMLFDRNEFRYINIQIWIKGIQSPNVNLYSDDQV